MELIESVIYFDKQQNLYNFPFTIKYNNHEHIINFYFNNGDYVDQESMLKERIDYCSKQLFNHFMEYFEYLQEICLDDSIEANNESVDNINELLRTILSLYNIFGKIHCNSMVTNRLRELLDELVEMFLLLEDYYTIERKKELHNWKVAVNNLLVNKC
jgi:hypothetical protein